MGEERKNIKNLPFLFFHRVHNHYHYDYDDGDDSRWGHGKQSLKSQKQNKGSNLKMDGKRTTKKQKDQAHCARHQVPWLKTIEADPNLPNGLDR